MRVAITGGTGFVGRHLAARLDNPVVVSRRTGVDVHDAESLAAAFAGCEVVAHFAGINRELGDQTYRRVHIEGTQAVIEAARRAGVRQIILMSFLRARPDCGSPYHESKWVAEQLVRESGLEYTVLKPGMIYGRGDHMIDHLSHLIQTVPVFATVGLRENSIRPLPVAEVIDVAVAAIEGRLTNRTVAMVGAETLTMSDAVRRVAAVLRRRVWVVRFPLWVHRMLAPIFEWTMKVPLVARAQVRILAEPSEPSGAVDPLPNDLVPTTFFSDEQIRLALPEPGGFGIRDLRIAR